MLCISCSLSLSRICMLCHSPFVCRGRALWSLAPHPAFHASERCLQPRTPRSICNQVPLFALRKIRRKQSDTLSELLQPAAAPKPGARSPLCSQKQSTQTPCVNCCNPLQRRSRELEAPLCSQKPSEFNTAESRKPLQPEAARNQHREPKAPGSQPNAARSRQLTSAMCGRPWEEYVGAHIGPTSKHRMGFLPYSL